MMCYAGANGSRWQQHDFFCKSSAGTVSPDQVCSLEFTVHCRCQCVFLIFKKIAGIDPTPGFLKQVNFLTTHSSRNLTVFFFTAEGVKNFFEGMVNSTTAVHKGKFLPY